MIALVFSLFFFAPLLDARDVRVSRSLCMEHVKTSLFLA
jgi:hypothetical protein